MLPGVQQRTVHLAFALALIYLLYPFRSKTDESREEKVSDEERRMSVIDFVFVGLSFAIGVYVFAEYENLSFRMGEPNSLW
ncbi:MAG: hypothetical protein H6Q55_2910 [Deltaproteobacteria bacterium]|nr:hypothetical protein [Deltaproteobacteria bacterium]